MWVRLGTEGIPRGAPVVPGPRLGVSGTTSVGTRTGTDRDGVAGGWDPRGGRVLGAGLKGGGTGAASDPPVSAPTTYTPTRSGTGTAPEALGRKRTGLPVVGTLGGVPRRMTTVGGSPVPPATLPDVHWGCVRRGRTHGPPTRPLAETGGITGGRRWGHGGPSVPVLREAGCPESRFSRPRTLVGSIGSSRRL